MSRATIVVRGDEQRDKAAAWAKAAPPGTRIEFKLAKRTIHQNDRMWAMLTEISQQMEWDGKRRNTNEWKLLFLDLLGIEVMVPNLDGSGHVNIGRSSSDLSKEEMSGMIELMYKFGAEHGVRFGDEDAA